MKGAVMKKPEDMLVYYGYLNSYNSATLGWNNESVALELSKLKILVLGDGLEDPTHPDYANTTVIMSRLKIDQQAAAQNAAIEFI